jgi:AraC family transcriptional regulator, regulatory protein of adaptative response / methylated-DNA-[protein]-cysteine methyltransferase
VDEADMPDMMTHPSDASGDDVASSIAWGIHPSPVGDCLVAVSDGLVCGLHFLDPMTSVAARLEVQRRWPAATLHRDDTASRDIARTIFADDATAANVPRLLRGTAFQINVWNELCQVPPGYTVCYEELARRIGAPTASRAVGAAVGRNSIAMLVPCHRAVRKDGSLGGFRWGVDRKRTLLARESARAGTQSGLLWPDPRLAGY